MIIVATAFDDYVICLFIGDEEEMGRYLNIGFGKMADDIRDDFYVDKSMFISVLNKRLESRSRFICVSRPRRF